MEYPVFYIHVEPYIVGKLGYKSQLSTRLLLLQLELPCDYFSWGEGQTENTCASAPSEGSFGVWARMHHDDRTAGRG
jgi:hypothetical protein